VSGCLSPTDISYLCAVRLSKPLCRQPYAAVRSPEPLLSLYSMCSSAILAASVTHAIVVRPSRPLFCSFRICSRAIWATFLLITHVHSGHLGPYSAYTYCPGTSQCMAVCDTLYSFHCTNYACQILSEHKSLYASMPIHISPLYCRQFIAAYTLLTQYIH
jgi:hypothetical protein